MSGILGAVGGAVSSGVGSTLGTLGSSVTSLLGSESVTGIIGAIGSALGVGGLPNLQQYQGLDGPAPGWTLTCDIVNVPGLMALSNVYINNLNFSFNHAQAAQRFRNGIYQQYPTQFMANPA